MAKNSCGVICRFLNSQPASGVILMIAAILAIIFANTPLRALYDLLLATPVGVKVGLLVIDKPMLLWINDGLMAIFFFQVGLELKREFLEGELKTPSNILLPAVGAVGGMAVPAAIYYLINLDNPVALSGWAIPAATDIAFALGVLALLGSRVPTSLKIFLTSLAIFDDVGAIIIIALFYTSKISQTALIAALLCLIVLFVFNRLNVTAKSIYLLVGIIMWVATLKSGVHATLAGVVLAFFVPMRSKTDPEDSPLQSLEHDLHGLVSFFVLPIFAFANAGISFAGMGLAQMFHGVPVGIALGLFVGKQIGIFGICWLTVKSGLARLPAGFTWARLYGVALLCGIGFTMSLFIGSLAFEESGVNLFFDERLGIIAGSLLSGVVGYLVLRRSLQSGEQ